MNSALSSEKIPFFVSTPAETLFASLLLFWILLPLASHLSASCYAGLFLTLSHTIQSKTDAATPLHFQCSCLKDHEHIEKKCLRDGKDLCVQEVCGLKVILILALDDGWFDWKITTKQIGSP